VVGPFNIVGKGVLAVHHGAGCSAAIPMPMPHLVARR
jgi:hypothetical protein